MDFDGIDASASIAAATAAAALYIAKARRRANRRITVSAPGKALVTGGYLVLERPNNGLVLATSARFYSSLQWKRLDNDAADCDVLRIVVLSPQFSSKHGYEVRNSSRGVVVSAWPGYTQQPNPYVEHTLTHTIAAILRLGGFTHISQMIDASGGSRQRYLCITLQADNDFYSQRTQLRRRGWSLGRNSLSKLPRFLPCPVDEHGKAVVAKTGMGSSAALITSLSGAIMAFFGTISLPSENAKELTHKMAQICHAAAQGKVGSGFDVCSAVFGSQHYLRFSKSVLQPLLQKEDLTTAVDPEMVNKMLQAKWDHRSSPFSLPPRLQLVMGDICGGSETPSMVRKVLAWKAGSPQDSGGSSAAERTWTELNECNDSINAEFEKLRALCSADLAAYASRLASCATARSMEQALTELARLFARARVLLRTMGEGAGVPIEPPEQTALVDATMELPGVLACGVPGAGGYDAVFAIIVHSGAYDALQSLWCNWQGAADARSSEEGQGLVCPLLLQAEAGGNDQAGIRSENM